MKHVALLALVVCGTAIAFGQAKTTTSAPVKFVNSPEVNLPPGFSQTAVIGTLSTAVIAGATADGQTSYPANADPMMMTIFLRHDETKTLDEINAPLDKTGFHKNFPPQRVEVVS